jgi:hypothetical protein
LFLFLQKKKILAAFSSDVSAPALQRRRRATMSNWIFALVAIGLWVVATLLYLKRPIIAWITEWRERRAAARAKK